MVYGYARVSSKSQANNGNGLEEQINALTIAGCEKIYQEQYTGTTTKRPQFNKLLSVLKEGDILTVTKLDRFARTAAGGSKLIAELLNKHVKVHVLNMGMIDDTPIGRVISNVLLAFAQFERDMIVERTQAGKAIARTKAGYREGRPPIPIHKKAAAVHLILDEHISYRKVVKITGISKTTLVRAVKTIKKGLTKNIIVGRNTEKYVELLHTEGMIDRK